jgi:hypothetical protein
MAVISQVTALLYDVKQMQMPQTRQDRRKMAYMRNSKPLIEPERTTVVKKPKLPKAPAPSRERDNPLRDHAASHHGYSGSRSFQHKAQTA